MKILLINGSIIDRFYEGMVKSYDHENNKHVVRFPLLCGSFLAFK